MLNVGCHHKFPDVSVFKLIIINGRNISLYKYIVQNGKFVGEIPELFRNSVPNLCLNPLYNCIDPQVNYHQKCFKLHSNIIQQQGNSIFKFTWQKIMKEKYYKSLFFIIKSLYFYQIRKLCVYSKNTAIYSP